MKINIKLLFVFLFVSMGVMTSQAQYTYIKTIAGNNGAGGYGGDGGAATNAVLAGPISITLDKRGNVYFVDYYNFIIRRISTDGSISLFGGTPHAAGYSGNGGYAPSCKMWPHAIIMDKNDNMYVSELSHDVIRKIDASSIINHFAGLSEVGYSGDSAYADTCRMNSPFGMAIDEKGNLFFADAANNVIRKIDTSGKIYTVVGTGVAGFSGDGFLATTAKLDSPFDVAVDKKGNLYISDNKNNRIRFVNKATGIISTYAGTGIAGYNRDTIIATTANLNYPAGIALDSNGNLYIADTKNNLIRMVDTFGIIQRVAGNQVYGFWGDGYPAVDANLANPYAVALDTFGNLYIADANNQRIRKTYNPLGVTNVNNNNEIHIYPNPCTSQIFIKGAVTGDKVCLYNAIGMQVTATIEIKNQGTNRIAIDEALPAGIYLLQVWDENGNKKSALRVEKQ